MAKSKQKQRTKKTLKLHKPENTKTISKVVKIREKVSRKEIRKYEIQRVEKIVRVLPKFIKFYRKLSEAELRAIKFYLIFGSFWQTKLLTSDPKKREIRIPFYKYENNSFRRDMIGNNANNLLPKSKSLDIKDMKSYIKDSLTSRITLLNRLEAIYNRPDCPKLSGEEILFRGVGMFPELKKKKEGDTIKFANFMSSTIDRKTAEIYSQDDTLLIMTGLKDVPFIYMPNSKNYGDKPFTKYMVNLDIYQDLSEFTLPRNLEFKIDAIREEHMSEFGWNWQKSSTFKKILTLLTKKGILPKETKNTKKNTKTVDNSNNTTEKTDTQINTSPEPSPEITEKREELIKEQIYPKFKVYYLSFVQRHQEPPITYEAITKNAKFVFDEAAVNSWKSQNDDGFMRRV